ncbi:LysM domain-containing protein [Modicisalibacter ilicicola DSM 19980]|uniref:LysM domain-containing protein n=1 Tax=Modicisalibacter ilicicola DSM 19980 TaxID=1121942 RepID=A0A1M4SZI6_9GAMM|nr:peptidoglycan DD-metalloendopeptidase family protein [Halomonas ilicicola]SHE37648.1 LysM domain-containing protein [Halomonas ilicicola DSM 19980]
MRKALLVTALALGAAGCAAPSSSPGPDVRDLSMARDSRGNGSVTVEEGDTLYGIAWRQNMDFRTLAQINDISPPYRLQPGQTLRLSQDGRASAAQAGNAGGQDDMTAGAAGAAGVSGTQAPDWLAPDTEAIERNRRLTSRPLESSPAASSSSTPSASPSSTRPNDQAMAAAGQAGGASGQGPIYNYDSPGADGQLSAQDRAEREELARQRAAAEQAEAQRASQGPPQAPGASNTQASASQQSDQATNQQRTQASASQQSNQAASQQRTQASASQQSDQAASQNRNTAATNTSPQGNTGSSAADAGTAVAGGADAPSAQQRSYTPVEEVPWQWPAEGQLVGRFGDGSSITAGIDIAGQKGQPVKAAGPGIVVYAGDGVRGYGNLILLKHNDSYLSAYAHNDSLRVRENDVVDAGEVIATMGDTDAESVKLHFEVRQDGQPRDPLEFLPQR